ncbi:MAG: hypothetical protein WCP29_18885 [Acidobacteriota bacterium]
MTPTTSRRFPVATWMRLLGVMLAGATLLAHYDQNPPRVGRPPLPDVQQVPTPAQPFRKLALNLDIVQASPLLADLDDESSLFQKLNVQNVVGRGTLAGGFAGKTVALENGRNESLANLTKVFIADQGKFASQARGAIRGALSRPVEIKEDVLEFDDAYAVVHATSVVVSDPRALATSSPEFATYLGNAQVPPNLSRASLTPESVPGFDAFVKTELPALPTDDPLRRAFEAGGESAVLKAIAEGRGTFEIMDTLYVPKTFAPMGPNGFQKPIIENGVVRYNRFRPVASALTFHAFNLAEVLSLTFPIEEPPPPPAPKEAASVTSTGSDRFDARFLAGFTRGQSWEWERKWKFTSGFFRITLRGHYGIGLRIPIAVSGSVSPTDIKVRNIQDQVVPIRTTLSVNTLDADGRFFREVGLDRDAFDGKEAVCEAGFGWGLKFRALWSNIVHVRTHDIADFSLGQNFKPPFGNDPDASYRLAIPAEMTGTNFNWGALSGFAQAAVRFDGKGSVMLDYQPFQGDRQLAVQHLRVTSTAPRNLDILLPPMPAERGKSKASQPYGFTLSKPSYTVALTMTPEVRASVTVGYSWVSHTFDTGWKSLNDFSVNLGSVTLGRHDGTRADFTYRGGTKTFEYIDAAPSTTQLRYRASLLSAQSHKYVRAGVGPQQLLTATSSRVSAWETFEIVTIGPGLVALKCLQNDKFVRIGIKDGNNERVAAQSARPDVLETFRLIDTGNNTVALQSIHTNKYIRAGDGRESFLAPTSAAIGGWEKFVIERLDERK